MKLPILKQFVITVFTTFITTNNALSSYKLDQIEHLGGFDPKYQTTHQTINLKNKYIVIIKIKDKGRNNNGEDFKPIARINYGGQLRKKKIYEERLRSQHNTRIKEITDFMRDRIDATKYLFEEIKRIERDRQVKDELRKMVAYLERPENKAEKDAVLNYFNKNNRIIRKKKKNVWDQHTNDLVINVMKDPFNDGTIN